jgi:hypothetical protein
MSPRRRIAAFPSALVAAAFLVAVGSPAPLRGASRPTDWRKPLTPYESAAAERAKAGAAQRLESPECQKLLTDFRDRQGAPLADRLTAWQMTASDYVRQLPFLDGASVPLCAKEMVRLVTVAGALQVYVCPGGPGRLNSHFSSVQAETPARAEAMVIHVMLHTLGLGENPPSTFEITERVRRRCR